MSGTHKAVFAVGSLSTCPTPSAYEEPELLPDSCQQALGKVMSLVGRGFVPPSPSQPQMESKCCSEPAPRTCRSCPGRTVGISLQSPVALAGQLQTHSLTSEQESSLFSKLPLKSQRNHGVLLFPGPSPKASAVCLFVWLVVVVVVFQDRFLFVALVVLEFCSVDQAGLLLTRDPPTSCISAWSKP